MESSNMLYLHHIFHIKQLKSKAVKMQKKRFYKP